MTIDLKATRKACERAYLAAQAWRGWVAQLHDLALIPRRGKVAPDGTAMGANIQANTGPRAHDSTLGKAAYRFAGRMSRDVTPNNFFDVKAGPALIAALRRFYQQAGDDAKMAVNGKLEEASAIGKGLFEKAEFALAADEMYVDLFAGQGALLAAEDADEIMRFSAIPAVEMALREDGYGRVNGQYWKTYFEAGQLPHMWPDPQFSRRLREIIDKRPEDQVCIVQAAELDPATKRWNFVVYEAERSSEDKDEDRPVYAVEGERTSPFITPRFYKVPGSAMGIGPGLLALPTAKTLDKVTELTIKAAAFAILGLWTYRNDRSFNPRTARMAPGQMWQVTSTGGPLGPSVQRLDMPGRYDISNIILQDLREQVKQITFDDVLPPDTAAVKSATEIAERIKRLASDLSGAYPRLVLEIVVPLVRRVFDVATKRGLIAFDGPLQGFTPAMIDQLVARVEVTSPIARTQQAQDISAIVDWLQIILTTAGPEVMMYVVKVEKVFTVIAEKLGIQQELIRSEGEKQALEKLVAGLVQQKLAEVQQQQGAPAAAPAAMAA